MKDKSRIKEQMQSFQLILDHYDMELKDKSSEMTDLQKKREAHLQSFMQFFPFKEGSILINGDRIIKLTRCRNVIFDKRTGYESVENEIGFYCFYKKTTDYGGFSDRECSDTFYISDLSSWTEYKNNPVELTEKLATA